MDEYIINICFHESRTTEFRNMIFMKKLMTLMDINTLDVFLDVGDNLYCLSASIYNIRRVVIGMVSLMLFQHITLLSI